MCRSADYQRFHSTAGDRLKIKAFFVHFSRLKSQKPPPKSLTLLYLPRIGETALEIAGAKIRPDSPAFVTLHRVAWSASDNDFVFGSRERVRAGDGVRFQVYLREDKVMQGTFRRGGAGDWKLECKSTLETEIAAGGSSGEICVDVDGGVAMFERVRMSVRRRKNRRFEEMEEIPEGREEDDESDGCSCSDEETGDPSDGGGDFEVEDGEGYAVEREIEGAKWAVDLGIWAVCLGVGFGYWAGKALRRRR